MRATQVAVAAALAALAALVPGGSATGKGLTPHVVANVRVSLDDLAPARAYTEPQLLVNRENPDVVVAAAVDLRTRACRLFRSRDAGRRWSLVEAPASPREFPYCSTDSATATQSPIAWGRSSTLYYAMVGWGGEEAAGCDGCGVAGNLSVILARSDDLGDTWRTSVVRDARAFRGTELERNRPVTSVAVDSTHGAEDIVYVGWRYDYPKKTATAGPRIATSTNAGKTFGDPVNPLKSYQPEVPELRSFTAYLTLAGDGTVYALITADEPGDELTRPVIATSTDQAKTFTVTDAGPAYPYFPRTAMEWSPQGGPQGTLHMVYEDKPDVPPAAGDTDIYYIRSTDGGKTFTPPAKITDDDPKRPAWQHLSAIAVAPNGRVDVAWWDFRDDPGIFANDVYYTYSLDNGATWAKNLRITDISSNRRIGTWAGNFDQRAPPGLASADAFAVLGWDDTRLGDTTTQTQDVFATTVQFAPIVRGQESGAVAYALATAAGVAAAGLLLLAVGELRRRPES